MIIFFLFFEKLFVLLISLFFVPINVEVNLWLIFRHMRTHARYEMQDSTSIEDSSVPLGGTDSPLPGSGSRSLGSGPGTSRSVSSESADIPPSLQQQQQQQVPVVKPPSPMDTEEEGEAKKPS